MKIRVKSETTPPESFANVDDAARSAVNRLLVLGGRVGLVCSTSQQKELIASLAKRLAEQQWESVPS